MTPQIRFHYEAYLAAHQLPDTALLQQTFEAAWLAAEAACLATVKEQLNKTFEDAGY